MSELVPKLRQIKVAPHKLILDPNNPRLISREEDQQAVGDALDLLDDTISRMRSGSGEGDYKIKELEQSIVQNGWVPVDFIFVRKLGEQGHYLVLEGNRRVTAIRNLLQNQDGLSSDLGGQLQEIEVMEIIDDLPEEEIKKKITYLLGVRHHGSLKKWSPFAQAFNIYKRYLELAGLESSQFEWKSDIGDQVADALSISDSEVKQRLKVYRAMEQIGSYPALQDTALKNGGIKDRYYSVCAEVLLTSNKSLREYVDQSDQDFLLSEQSVERMINLCHFESPSRQGAPINNPQEWRKLANILADEDPVRRSEMLERVEQGDKERPSIVWAERSAELQKLRWDTWLGNVLAIVGSLKLEDDLTSDDARETTQRLAELVSKLDELDEA